MTIKKKLCIVLIILLTILLIALSVYLILNFKHNKDINDIYNIYSEENIQDRLIEITSNKLDNTNDNTEFTYMLEEKNDENVIGVIKIDKINYEGLVYKGTSLDTLAKGVGHLDSTDFFDGNVGLAAHNTRDKWGKLYTLELGDTINYTSFLGTRQYEVTTIKEIEETDFSLFEHTEDNRITLVTCIVGKPNLRLCVQATEK